MNLDLTHEEATCLTTHLREVIKYDHCPVFAESPRMARDPRKTEARPRTVAAGHSADDDGHRSGRSSASRLLGALDARHLHHHGARKRRATGGCAESRWAS
jgi:hypothetical protein